MTLDLSSRDGLVSIGRDAIITSCNGYGDSSEQRLGIPGPPFSIAGRRVGVPAACPRKQDIASRAARTPTLLSEGTHARDVARASLGRIANR